MIETCWFNQQLSTTVSVASHYLSVRKAEIMAKSRLFVNVVKKVNKNNSTEVDKITIIQRILALHS